LLLLIGCGSASAVSRDVTCAGVMRGRRVWFDIGSNNGAYTNELLIRRPGMFERAFLFEPNPRFIRELNLLHARHPEARHVQKAAWITDGSITFHIGRNDEASSILKERSHVHANTKCASASEFDQRTAYAGNASSSQQIVRRWGARSICDVPRQVTVPSINVADFVERESCPHDKLSLKMDIEGAEYTVIHHLLKSGVACRFATMLIEWHAVQNLTNHIGTMVPWQAKRAQFKKRLKGCGVNLGQGFLDNGHESF